MYIHNLNSVIVNFGFIEIRWYSLAYIFGIILGWWLGKKIIVFHSDTNNIKNNIKIFDDLISYVIFAIIIGGRLGYVMFYNFNFYLDNPINVLKIWEGGMSFHGALIGVVITTFLFAKKNKKKPFFLLDVLACVTPIGLFFGRIANFINAELYGKPTSNNFISVVFPNIDDLPRHPSQLYESFLEGFLLFVLLNIVVFRKNYRLGSCSVLFLILYGIFRIISEQFREPDAQIGYLFSLMSMGTLLSSLMIIIGFILFLKINKNESKY